MSDQKEQFLNAMFEAINFQLDDECKEYDLSPALIEEWQIHGESFYVRALLWFDHENCKRAEKDEPIKFIFDLAHDFVFTALGHGAGFWEKGVTDWLYYNDNLEKLAKCYFYESYSFYVNDDNEISGG
jgi:hypothetical protein